MTNATMTSTNSTAFQSVRVLPPSAGLANFTRCIEAPRKRPVRKIAAAALAFAAITIGGITAVHVGHASASVNTPQTVQVDASSNPNSAANKTIAALTLDASSTIQANSSASLPALGAQASN